MPRCSIVGNNYMLWYQLLKKTFSCISSLFLAEYRIHAHIIAKREEDTLQTYVYQYHWKPHWQDKYNHPIGPRTCLQDPRLGLNL